MGYRLTKLTGYNQVKIGYYVPNIFDMSVVGEGVCVGEVREV